MSSNLADLPLDLLADLPPLLTSSGQEEFKFGRSTLRSAGRSTLPVLTSSGQDEFKFGTYASRSTPWYWHLVVKIEFKFGRSTPQYWHLVVKMSSNFADLPPPDHRSLDIILRNMQSPINREICRSRIMEILPFQCFHHFTDGHSLSLSLSLYAISYWEGNMQIWHYRDSTISVFSQLHGWT